MKRQSTLLSLFFTLSLTVLIASCATNNNRNVDKKSINEDIVGLWYGKVKLDNGTLHHWIANHHENGQLNLEFKGVKDTKITYRDTEEGFWHGDDAQFTSQIRARYSENGIRQEVSEEYTYKIIEVQENKMIYSNADYTFEAIRIDSNFRL